MFILLVTIAGCGSQAPSPPVPSSPPTPAAQPFNLYTHCGADWRTRFDGSYWDLDSPIVGPLDNPYQLGTMRLLGQRTARFEYQSAGHNYALVFRRHPEGVALKPPAGCD